MEKTGKIHNQSRIRWLFLVLHSDESSINSKAFPSGSRQNNARRPDLLNVYGKSFFSNLSLIKSILFTVKAACRSVFKLKYVHMTV